AGGGEGREKDVFDSPAARRRGTQKLAGILLLEVDGDEGRRFLERRRIVPIPGKRRRLDPFEPAPAVLISSEAPGTGRIGEGRSPGRRRCRSRRAIRRLAVARPPVRLLEVLGKQSQ